MHDSGRYWNGRLALAGVAAAIAAVAIGLDLASWWVVLALVLASAFAGASIARNPPGPLISDSNAAGEQDSHDDTSHELLELVEHPLLIVDAKRRVEYANTRASSLLGEHIVGQDVRVALRNPAAAAMLTKGVSAGAHVELPDLGGPEQRWELLADPLEDRQVVRLVDRSALRAAERMRVDFVANASHELRTPLATIIGFIETLEGPAADDPAASKRFLAIMHGEARRMLRLVDDLMSLSRIESTKHTPPTNPVDIVQLVEEVRTALGGRLAKEDRSIVLDSEEGVSLVAGDRDQLLQLLHNLVGNAIKYGRKGTPITVRIRQDGLSMVRMSVEDQGEGIAPEHLPRLTERFYRIDASRSRSIGGTGLGLAIVKHIVERHRGQLLIDSEIGVGTRMTTLLPAVTKMAGSSALSQ